MQNFFQTVASMKSFPIIIIILKLAKARQYTENYISTKLLFKLTEINYPTINGTEFRTKTANN